MATATKHYVWGPIKTGTGTIKPGTVVSEKDFSEDDWNQLVEGRVVRTNPFPDIPETYKGSPKRYRMMQIRKQLAEMDDLDLDDVEEDD